MNDVTDKLVQQLAAPILAQHKKDKGFLGRRNRSAWKRMNRPEKAQVMERGIEKIHALLGRFKMRDNGFTGV